MIEGHYINGKYDGLWTQWYANGQVFLQGKYNEDMLIGEWTQWYKNGNKYFSGNYNDSNQEGAWIYYSPDASDSTKVFYSNGKPKIGKKIEWYDNGLSLIHI